MDEQKWNANKLKMTTHFDTYANCPQEPAVMALIAVGDENIDQQENAWNSITAMCRGMPNSPIGRGRQTDIDPAILAGAKKVCYGAYRDAHVASYADLTSTCGEQILWLRGGHAITDAEAYGDYYAKQKYDALLRAYRANEEPKETDRVLWTGAFAKNGNPTGITLNPKVTEETTTEASE